MKVKSFLVVMLLTTGVFADPIETSTVTLTRNTQSAGVLSAQLNKNAYIMQPYDAHYTVSVPYDVQEAYQDPVTTYQQQYVCHDVTTYQQQCHDETSCGRESRLVAMLGVHVPPPGGGGSDDGDTSPPGIHDPGPSDNNDNGGYNPFPPTTDDPGVHVPPPPVCSTHTVCDQVPVTTQQCDYEQVPVVTYVTKYRTVTEYRDEDRCCRTEYQQVFDHQDALQVNVQFPASAQLLAGEEESISLTMESATQVTLNFGKTVFGYAIDSQSVNNGVAQFVLKTVPRYTATDLGASTIQNLTLTINGAQSKLSFQDQGLRRRVATTYSWQIVDQDTKKVVTNGQLQATATGTVSLQVPTALDFEKTYALQLAVHREGVVLAQSIDFTTVVTKQKEVVDTKATLDPATVADPQFIQTSSGVALAFVDKLPNYQEVQSSYEVKIERRGGFLDLIWETMVDKTFARSQFPTGSVRLNAAKDLGISAGDISSYLSSGDKVRVTLTVKRTSSLIDGGKLVQLPRQVDLTVP